jgi:arsenate reductase
VPVTIHGIRACDTMRKARAWLEAQGIAHAFHDYRADGLDRALLESWVRRLGWEALLNRAGTTFRSLPEAMRQDLTEERAVALMLSAPAIIRRPVLTAGETLQVGFAPARWAEALRPVPA